jgi:hypothetical protein
MDAGPPGSPLPTRGGGPGGTGAAARRAPWPAGAIRPRYAYCLAALCKRSRAVGQTVGAPYAPQLGIASVEISTSTSSAAQRQRARSQQRPDHYVPATAGGSKSKSPPAQTPRLVGACERQARVFFGGALRCLACSERPSLGGGALRFSCALAVYKPPLHNNKNSSVLLRPCCI